MKYIIDIPETYKYAVEIGMTKNGSIASKVILNAVKDGIPYIERPHGEWKNGMCTNCGAECFEDYYMRDIKTEFCHRCGADMRTRKSDEDYIDEDARQASIPYSYNKHIKIGDTIYTQDDDKQGWTGKEENK